MKMDEDGAISKPPKGYGRIPAIVALTPIAICWLVWGPLGILCYVSGRFNSMFAFTTFFGIVLATLAAVVAFPVLVVRMAVTWRRRPLRERWRIVPWIALTGGFVVPYALGLAGLTSTPFDLFVRGFLRYAEHRVDVEAIRVWLATVDPNDYPGANGRIDKLSVESRLPPCIAELAPRYVMVQPDDVGRPMVRLLWGSGMIGSWGIDVGRKDMPTPPSEPAESHEQRYPLAPGAYVWSGD